MVIIGNVSPPEEGLIYTTNNLQLKIGDKVIGSGTLYISQSSLSWAPDDKPEGISIMWKQISVHGISSNPVKCIYFMLDHQLLWHGVYDGAANGHNGNDAAAVLPMDQNDDADDGEEDEGNETDNEEEDQMTECWLIPADVNTVDTIFQSMTECQALHPDSADSISEESVFMDDGEEDDENGMGPTGADGGNGHDEGDADAEAQGGMQNLNINDDRFADADE